MTTNAMASPTVPIQLAAKDKRAILENVLAALRKRFYSPEKLNGDWHAAIERHKVQIESAATPDEFERAMSDLLAELQTSHIGFFHSSARRASSRAALSAAYLADETPYGKRWIFQDVHSGGAASIAGIEPGDILLTVDGREILPPEHPVFPMGKQTQMEIVGSDDQRRAVTVDVARPKGKKLHFVEPTLVETRVLKDGTGYLKIAMFPDMVGVKVANEISDAVAQLGAVESLIIDLRGNTGGGIGALRVMSLLTPERIPVGFALDRRRVTPNLGSEKERFRRFSRIPSSTKMLWLLAVQFAPAMMTKKPIVLQTEGLGKQAVSRTGRSASGSAHRERGRNDCCLCQREQARHNRRRKDRWPTPLRNLGKGGQRISTRAPDWSVLHMEGFSSGRHANRTGQTDRIRLAPTTPRRRHST